MISADELKTLVTMPDLLDYYGIPHGQGRIPCPLHNGKDKNFGFTRDQYHCFVCGKGGDVIRFVQDYDGLTFREALVKLSCIAGAGEPTADINQKRIKAEHKAAKIRELKRQKDALIAQKHEYEDILSAQTPASSDIMPSEEWLNALGDIGWICCRINELHREIEELEGISH